MAIWKPQLGREGEGEGRGGGIKEEEGKGRGRGRGGGGKGLVILSSLSLLCVVQDSQSIPSLP